MVRNGLVSDAQRPPTLAHHDQEFTALIITWYGALRPVLMQRFLRFYTSARGLRFVPRLITQVIKYVG